MNAKTPPRLIPLACLLLAHPASAQTTPKVDEAADARARATVSQMTADEKLILTHGIMVLPMRPGFTKPADAVIGAGYIAGIPRLAIPSLKETDASLGVSGVMGLRKDDGATALPAGVAMASTWNPELLRRGGAAKPSSSGASQFPGCS